jgi:ketosteroid isomerase-like protein
MTRRYTRIASALCPALLLFSGSTSGEGSNAAAIEQKIKQLEEERRVALLDSDQKTLERIYAVGMTTVDIEGNLHTNTGNRAARLNTPGTRTTASWVSDEMKVSVFGETAIVTQLAHIADVLRGEKRDFKARLTHVWVRSNGQWQIVARHATRTSDH